MKNSGLNILNSFQRQIFNYIKDYHPYILEDRKIAVEMIIKRADKAQEAYSNSIKEGRLHYWAMKEANEALHAGLEFSPISYLKEFYEEATDITINDKEAIEMYKKTTHIFNEYGNDIEGSDKEEELREELIEALGLNKEELFKKYKETREIFIRPINMVNYNDNF